MTEEKTVSIDIPENGFINAMMTLESGYLIDELDEDIKAMVALARQRGGEGKIQLTVKISRAGSQPGVMNVGYDKKVTEPKRETVGAIMFADNEQGLVTYQPDQKELAFSPVADDSDSGKVSPINPNGKKDKPK